jgi:hypothetical protein
MIAITSDAHHLFALYFDDYAAQGCANTAVTTLGSGYALSHGAGNQRQAQVAHVMLAPGLN